MVSSFTVPMEHSICDIDAIVYGFVLPKVYGFAIWNIYLWNLWFRSMKFMVSSETHYLCAIYKCHSSFRRVSLKSVYGFV